MPNARIYQIPKNAMQSGRAKTHTWMLEFEPAEPKQADPLTGAGRGDASSSRPAWPKKRDPGSSPG